MIYFGENQEYILAECEICKSEMYLEKETVVEETAYTCRLATPVKCACGSIDEYVNKAKKSCYSIRQDLLKLSDLLHKRQNISEQINEINLEINKKIKHPSFLQIFLDDIIFSLKIFFIIVAATLGLEIFLFIISCLLFFIGVLTQMPDLSRAGNAFFYHINIFKDQGGGILSKFGLSEKFPVLDTNLSDNKLILDYIPYALVGILIVVFYVSLIILVVRLIISAVRTGIYASRVVNQKYVIAQKKEEYEGQLNILMKKYQDLSDQINAQTILSGDYKNSKSVDKILRYFLNNRVDSLREAINLYHDEELKSKTLEYQKAIFSEIRQTKRYTKALYILSSDDNVKVDVHEEVYENDDTGMGETLRDAFNKLRKSSATSRIKAQSIQAIDSSTSAGESDESKDDEADEDYSNNSTDD